MLEASQSGAAHRLLSEAQSTDSGHAYRQQRRSNIRYGACVADENGKEQRPNNNHVITITRPRGRRGVERPKQGPLSGAVAGTWVSLISVTSHRGLHAQLSLQH